MYRLCAEKEAVLQLHSMPVDEEIAYIAEHPEEIMCLIAWLVGCAGLDDSEK